MLSQEKIIELLNTLHEHTMAKEIFVPLLKKMGMKGVRFTGINKGTGTKLREDIGSAKDHQGIS